MSIKGLEHDFWQEQHVGYPQKTHQQTNKQPNIYSPHKSIKTERKKETRSSCLSLSLSLSLSLTHKKQLWTFGLPPPPNCFEWVGKVCTNLNRSRGPPSCNKHKSLIGSRAAAVKKWNIEVKKYKEIVTAVRIGHGKHRRIWARAKNSIEVKTKQRVCHTMALPFTFKSILRQKQNFWKLKYFTMQKYNLQKIL
jgi:hypothetical protein